MTQKIPIKIYYDHMNPSNQKVFMNDEEISRSIQGINLSIFAGKIPVLTLYVKPDVEFPEEFDAIVRIVHAPIP